MTAVDNTIRARALKLLELGLITQSEAAALARVSRQLVRHWCMADKLDATKARRRYLRELWRLN